MWHTIKHTNKCIIGIQEVEEEEKGAEKIQLKTKNFWNILKHNNLHIWKALQTVYDKYKKVHDKTHHSKCADCQRHIENIETSKRKKWLLTYKRIPNNINSCLLIRNNGDHQEVVNMFKVLKDT